MQREPVRRERSVAGLPDDGGRTGGRHGANPSLRIGYVLTDYPKLAMTFITGEIDEVEKRGHHVVPIAMNPPSEEDVSTGDGRRRRDQTLYLKEQGAATMVVRFIRLTARHPGRTSALALRAIRSARADLDLAVRRLAHLLYAATVVEHCRRENVRHLHAHFGQSPATIAWFATEIGNFDDAERWTWSFTIHGFQDFVDEAVARLDLKAASAEFVVCVSDFTRSQLCRVTDPRWWKRFEVVRCGIDTDEFPFREHPSQSSPPVVTMVARLSPEKGHGTLFEAIRLLRHQKGIEVRLELIGGGPSRDDLRELASDVGVERSVHFVGELSPDQVAGRLRHSDAFCLPSFSEGLPISIMEAMSIGVPVVATHIAGIPELAIHRETALTVSPGNAPELADALAELLTDPALRRRLTTAARRAVEARHTRAMNVDELLALFERHVRLEAPSSSASSAAGWPS